MSNIRRRVAALGARIPDPSDDYVLVLDNGPGPGDPGWDPADWPRWSSQFSAVELRVLAGFHRINGIDPMKAIPADAPPVVRIGQFDLSPEPPSGGAA